MLFRVLFIAPHPLTHLKSCLVQRFICWLWVFYGFAIMLYMFNESVIWKVHLVCSAAHWISRFSIFKSQKLQNSNQKNSQIIYVIEAVLKFRIIFFKKLPTILAKWSILAGLYSKTFQNFATTWDPYALSTRQPRWYSKL